MAFLTHNPRIIIIISATMQANFLRSFGSLHRPERRAFRALAESNTSAKKKTQRKSLHLTATKTPISRDRPAYIASFLEISRGFLLVTTKTLRTSVRQNSVQICTACTFTEFQAHFIAINHQARIVSKKRRPRARKLVKCSLSLGKNGG